ncbi:MAG: hypothetical protein JZU65_20995, partial [Chlorobium sp.]|nr:hypothetical protein [Chlorobium sp.]
AHGRRDYSQGVPTQEKLDIKQGYTSDWDRTKRQTCEAFFKELQGDDVSQPEKTGDAMKNMLTDCLAFISRDRTSNQTCEAFFKRHQEDDDVHREETGEVLKNILNDCLAFISRDRIK